MTVRSYSWLIEVKVKSHSWLIEVKVKSHSWLTQSSPYREAEVFSALHVPDVFSSFFFFFCFLINGLIRTSVSGICRSPDPRHLNVPDHVKTSRSSSFLSAF